MDARRLAPTVGLLASVLVVVLVVVPYAIVPEGSAVGTYYGAGAINGLVVVLFALVAVVVFAAGRQGRTEPDTVAGAAVGLGVFMVVVAAVWAATVPGSLVSQLSTATVLGYHRGALVLATLLVPLAAAWYVSALELL